MPAIRSGWYAGLQKPLFAPPDWLFGPVWTVLYFTMAVAAWMVWKFQSDNSLVKPALLLFFAQLILNVLWSAFFFSMLKPGWALVDIVLLWALVMVMVVFFFRINRWAGLILVPYLGWLLYAAVLNGAIWWLNRGPLPPGSAVVS